MTVDQIREQIVIAYVTTFGRKPTEDEVEGRLSIILAKPRQFPVNLASVRTADLSNDTQLKFFQ